MIKGVNKKVLEINNPQSIYFEKAVLYLKPNMSTAPEKLISREADDFIKRMSPKQPKYAVLLRGFLTVSAVISVISVIFVTGYLILNSMI